LSALVVRMSAGMERMTGLVRIATGELQASDAKKAGFAGRLRVANHLASELSPVADELESVAEGCDRHIARIDAGMECLLDLIEQDPAQLKEISAFREVIGTLAARARETNAIQIRWATTIRSSGKFAKSLRITTRRMADAAARVTRVLERTETWEAR